MGHKQTAKTMKKIAHNKAHAPSGRLQIRGTQTNAKENKTTKSCHNAFYMHAGFWQGLQIQRGAAMTRRRRLQYTCCSFGLGVWGWGCEGGWVGIGTGGMGVEDILENR